MKAYYNNIKLYLFTIVGLSILTSCSTSQRLTSSSDGIYDDTTTRRQISNIEKKATEPNSKENSFTEELRRIENLNNSDIVTDIDNYKSERFYEEENTDQETRNRINYNNRAWGENTRTNNDVIVNINTYPRYGFYNDWYFDSYYGYNYRPFRRYNYNWSYNNYYNPYWHPYHWNSGFHIGLGWNNGWYRNPYRYYGYRNYPYYYGERYHSPYRRGANPNRNSYRTARIGESRNYERTTNYRRSTSNQSRNRTYNRTSSRSNKNYNSSRNTRINRSSRTYRRTPNSSERRTNSPVINRNTNRTRRGHSTQRNNTQGRTRSYSPSRSTRSSRGFSSPSTNRSRSRRN